MSEGVGGRSGRQASLPRRDAVWPLPLTMSTTCGGAHSCCAWSASRDTTRKIPAGQVGKSRVVLVGPPALAHRWRRDPLYAASSGGGPLAT